MSDASLKAIEPHKFKKGHNRAGPGNPLAKKVNQLRADLVKAVTRQDITDIATKLKEKAKAGDVAAIRELFDRLFGKANQPIELTGAGGEAVRVSLLHTFNHDRFTDLFSRADAGGVGGTGRAGGDGPTPDRN